MASIIRQPFAPLDGARLQSLTSAKNRQNALPTPAGKRKVSDLAETDDFENLDPIIFSKRSKGVGSFFPNKDILLKAASSIVLTKAAAPPTAADENLMDAFPSAVKPASIAPAAPRPRAVLQPKSRSAKLGSGGGVNFAASLPAPLPALSTALSSSPHFTAPAGRSPTRLSPFGGSSFTKGGRHSGSSSGIMSSRRGVRGGLGSGGAPFSLDAALKGTIPGYRARSSGAGSSSRPETTASLDLLLDGDSKSSSWSFAIHEDTPEQEMTNLLNHSTCVLDISSDEESALRARHDRDRAEGKDKENVPPPDDVSQTTNGGARRSAAAAAAAEAAPAGEDDMLFEKTRDALGELPVEEYYAPGCGKDSVVLVESEEVEGEAPLESISAPVAAADGEDGQDAFAPRASFCMPDAPSPESDDDAATDILVDDGASERSADSADDQAALEALMGKGSEDEGGAAAAAKEAALLQPMEGTGETFDLWESGSAKDGEQ